jgi:hypothetical protein
MAHSNKLTKRFHYEILATIEDILKDKTNFVSKFNPDDKTILEEFLMSYPLKKQKLDKHILNSWFEKFKLTIKTQNINFIDKSQFYTIYYKFSRNLSLPMKKASYIIDNMKNFIKSEIGKILIELTNFEKSEQEDYPKSDKGINNDLQILNNTKESLVTEIITQPSSQLDSLDKIELTTVLNILEMEEKKMHLLKDDMEWCCARSTKIISFIEKTSEELNAMNHKIQLGKKELEKEENELKKFQNNYLCIWIHLKKIHKFCFVS